MWNSFRSVLDPNSPGAPSAFSVLRFGAREFGREWALRVLPWAQRGRCARSRVKTAAQVAPWRLISLIFDQKPLGKQGEGSYRCILTIRPALRPKMRGPMSEGRGKRAFATGRRVGAAVATRPCALRGVSSCCVLLVCAAPVAGDAARASAVVSPWNRCPLRQRLRIKPRSAGKRGGPARRGTSPALRRGMMRRSCAAILLFGV